MNLEKVGKLLAEHSPTPTEHHVKLAQAESERAALQRMTKWMSWGMFVVGIGVLLLVANKSFDLGRWFNLLASSFLLSGIGLATYGVFGAMRAGSTHPKFAASEPNEIGKTETTKSLASDHMPLPLPSVTERTTDLLRTRDVSESDE